MKRWDLTTNKNVTCSEVDMFLKEIDKVCKKHGFSISYEDDYYGAFIIENYDSGNIDWLKRAFIRIKEKK